MKIHNARKLAIAFGLACRARTIWCIYRVSNWQYYYPLQYDGKKLTERPFGTQYKSLTQPTDFISAQIDAHDKIL